MIVSGAKDEAGEHRSQMMMPAAVTTEIRR